MTSDDEKAKFGAFEHRDNGREWHISYWNCWHCKTCEAKLIRMCGCGILFEDHAMEEWMSCADEEVSQICPDGCRIIGGLSEFAGNEQLIDRTLYDTN